MDLYLAILKRQAEHSAQFRGHTLGQWQDSIGWANGPRSYAECTDCDCWVMVETRPAPNGIDIGGAAVAIGCGD